ncbi:CBO0543 family protein [Paenibacillus sp. N3.4]|uniref:CBO0543 family protein n=1 Tax=Paenibacillus sp. N3.4 TaxID=2603222 RepID=UPI0011CB78F5|nr:CBO0543 family protein [Paenibacillus sp. N3.4]TXK76095.1 hypothetical protein FU659_26225 [Paenibacillus sp. N3.4]
MTVDRTILITVWVVCLIIIPLTVPKKRAREAALLFLCNQTITWTLSVLFVEMNLYVNPIREFPFATGSNFTNNYLFFPLLSVIFNLYYPKTSHLSLNCFTI